MLFNMPKISFFLRSNNDLKKTYVLYCRVTFNGAKTEFSLKEKIDPGEWDKKTQRLAKKSNQKTFLDHLQSSIEYKLKTIAVSNESMTAGELVKNISVAHREKKNYVGRHSKKLHYCSKAKNFNGDIKSPFDKTQKSIGLRESNQY